MTLNYFIQHKLFKQMILSQVPREELAKAIENEDADFFTGLLALSVAYFGSQAPDEKDMIRYETEFIPADDVKIVRCKFTGDLPPRPAECSSMLIALTDAPYYFTVEHSFGGQFMLCRWDGDNHQNYGPVSADDPAVYIDTIINTIKN